MIPLSASLTASMASLNLTSFSPLNSSRIASEMSSIACLPSSVSIHSLKAFNISVTAFVTSVTTGASSARKEYFVVSQLFSSALFASSSSVSASTRSLLTTSASDIAFSHSPRPALNNGSRSRQLFPNTSIERASASRFVDPLSCISEMFSSVSPSSHMMSILSRALPVSSSVRLTPSSSHILRSPSFQPPFIFLVILSRALMIVLTSVSMISAAYCHRCSSSGSIPYRVASVLSWSAHSPASANVSRITFANPSTFLIAFSTVPVIPVIPSVTVLKLTFFPIVCSVAW